MTGALVWAGVAAAGGMAALGRLHLTVALARLAGSRLPWGTLAANALATAGAGAVAALDPGRVPHALVALGLLGSLSTFSTWMLEAHRMAARGRVGAAALNLLVMAAAGAAAAAAGYGVAAAVA